MFTVNALVLSFIIDKLVVCEGLEVVLVVAYVLDDALRAVFYEVLQELQRLVNLAPVLLALGKALVDHRHDFVEMLVVGRSLRYLLQQRRGRAPCFVLRGRVSRTFDVFQLTFVASRTFDSISV